jgi:hypothetical protein
MVTTIDFSQSDYTDNMPIFGTPGNYDKKLKFANKTATLTLGNTDYGYAVYSFSYSGPVDYVSISFLDSDGGDVSVASGQTSLYQISNNISKWEYILKNDTYNGITTYYVVVNGDTTHKTERLSVLIAMGKRGTPPVTSSVSITCDCALPLYKYETGLHVYSPYDAISTNAKLTTTLSSFTPIENWGINTAVYSGLFLQNPAAPYYYGYGTKVYKVGGRFDRSYGTQSQVTIKKKLFGKPKTSTQIYGPKLWYDSINETSDACTMPFLEKVGIIIGVDISSTIAQPQEYRYYLGYNPLLIRPSNDSVFTKYSFATQSHNPIVGATHALSKILLGIVSGYDRRWVLNEWAAGATIFGLSMLIPLGAGTGFSSVGASVYAFFDYLVGPLVPQAFAASTGFGQFIIAAVTNPFVIAAALLILLLIVIFSSKTKRYREPCKQFLHHFTGKPYIEVSTVGNDTTLYRDPTLTVVNNGYYCDGVYYYQQSGGKVISKNLSYTNAIVNDNPVKFAFQYSLQADSPVLVDDYNKLIVLPYTSGKPLPFCNGTVYYNNQILTQTITPNCCDLETGTSTVITIEIGSEFSCISQQDANDKAQAAFDAALDYALNYANYCSPFDDEQLGELNTNFTHELKIETVPTQTTIFYNSTLGAAQVGTNLYYDNSGCQKVLNGYYGVTGTTPYCTFYRTTNGAIDGIYVMTNPNSTTTVTGQPIVTENVNYSSNWFYSGSNFTTLSYITNAYEYDSSFNPNSLYSDIHMKKGMIDNLTTLDDFQLYNDFVGTTYSEAPSGWYRPLVDWISNDPFYYYREQTITLNIDEYCGIGLTKGFYITGILDGLPTTPPNPVTMVINVYTENIGLSGTYNATTSNYNSSTFVNYGGQIGYGETVTGITITSITNPNPSNKTTYVAGETSLCPTPTQTPTKTPTQTQTPTRTQTPTTTTTLTATPTQTRTQTPTTTTTLTATPTQTRTQTPTTTTTLTATPTQTRTQAQTPTQTKTPTPTPTMTSRPNCPDRRIVIQVCNSNSAIDDNFNVYLNGTYIGFLNLNSNAQVGSIFIGDTGASVTVTEADFTCPLSNMVTYKFDSETVILGGNNVLFMQNVQNNGNGNVGTVEIRNYLLVGNDLEQPCGVANLNYSGPSGSNFTFNFNYNECCAFTITPTQTQTPTRTPTQTPTRTQTQTPTQTPTNASCSAPILSSVTLVSGSLFTYNYSVPTNCTALTLSYSRDQVNWVNNTSVCSTGRQTDTLDATGTWYFRLTQTCTTGGAANSNVVSYVYTTPTQTPTQTKTPTQTPTPSTLNFFYMDPTPFGDSNDACSAPAFIEDLFYHNGEIGLPFVGDYVFTDSESTPFNGGNSWYQTSIGPTALQIDFNGLVIDRVICNTP